MAAPVDTLKLESEPTSSFPYFPIRESERQAFKLYGTTGHVTGTSYDSLIRQLTPNCDDLKTVYSPVLPLLFEDERQQRKDFVWHAIKERHMKQILFVDDIRWFAAEKKKSTNRVRKRALSDLDKVIKTCDKTGKLRLGLLNEKLTPWLRSELQNYQQIKHCYGRQLNNSKFTGGCIAYLPRDHNSGHLITPSGPEFKEIKLTHVQRAQDGLLHVNKVSNIQLHDTIYGISLHKVCDEDLCCVKTDKVCRIYQLEQDGEDSYKLVCQNEVNVPEASECFQSFSVSPYIRSDCCLATQSEDIYLWKEGRMDKVASLADSEHYKENSWCNVHYGCHPRSLVYTNQTVVKLFDLRAASSPVDMFSMDELCDNGKEQFRLCQTSPESTFYQRIATDYSFILLDERFPKKPVLKQDHMLQTMPQYMSGFSLSQNNIVYLASQCQPVIHRLAYSVTAIQPLQIIGPPRLIPRRLDLCQVPEIRYSCKHAKLLKQRLGASLAGVTAVPNDDRGSLIFQLDGHGEIFYQEIHEDKENLINQASNTNTDCNQPNMNPAGIKQAISWARKWEGDTLKVDDEEASSGRDITDIFANLTSGMPGFMVCPLCMTKISQVVGTEDYSSVRCALCNGIISESQNLKETCENDGVMPSVDKVRIPKDLPKIKEPPDHWNLLTQILYNSWIEDPIVYTLMDKMLTQFFYDSWIEDPVVDTLMGSNYLQQKIDQLNLENEKLKKERKQMLKEFSSKNKVKTDQERQENG